MASEVLSIPEDKLREFIDVIRAGLEAKLPGTSSETRRYLERWCDEEEAYLDRLERAGDAPRSRRARGIPGKG